MKPTAIMIHHTAVSYDKNPDQFKATNAYHEKKWHFGSSLGYYCAYHYEIAKNGKLTQARKDGEEAAACYQKNMNDGHCIHICLDGDFDHETPAPEQIYSLRDLLRLLCSKYEIDGDNLFFHRDYAHKTCPGKNLDKDVIKSLILDINKD